MAEVIEAPMPQPDFSPTYRFEKLITLPMRQPVRMARKVNWRTWSP
jgi:hypothetical protein